MRCLFNLIIGLVHKDLPKKKEKERAIKLKNVTWACSTVGKVEHYKDMITNLLVLIGVCVPQSLNSNSQPNSKKKVFSQNYWLRGHSTLN